MQHTYTICPTYAVFEKIVTLFLHNFLQYELLRVYIAIKSKPYSLRGQIKLGGQNMDNDKKKKIIAFVITAIISLIISVSATLLGIQPDALKNMIPDSDIVAVDVLEAQ